MPQQTANEVKIECTGDGFAEEQRLYRGATLLAAPQRFRCEMVPGHVSDHVGGHMGIDENVAALVRAPKGEVEKESTIQLASPPSGRTRRRQPVSVARPPSDRHRSRHDETIGRRRW